MILDTNVISELMRPAPDPAVLRWIESKPQDHLLTTSITVAEIQYGIRRLPAGRRRDQLADAAAGVFAGFSNQVLPFDHDAALQYAQLVVDRERAGRPISALDAQIAGICRSTSNALATRNTTDFVDSGVELIDPWSS